MTILATSAIYVALRNRAIVCEPPPERIEGAHIDVRIGAHYWVERIPAHYTKLGSTTAMLLADTDPLDCFARGDDQLPGYVVIPAGGFILAHTQEYIGTAPGSGLLACLHTRSTLARWRLGVCTSNAGLGDEGYCSRWTLELENNGPRAVALPVGARVGCITFHRLEGSATPYARGTRYNAKAGEWTPGDMLPKKGNW